MNKRIVCFLLALVLVLGMIPSTVITANAASNRTTSTKAIEVLMEKQGFKQYQYESGGKYYIGYGSEIKKDSYPNGISKEDAIQLVRDYVSDIVDDAINSFTKKNNLDLEQYEHDALALYSYRTNDVSWLKGGNDLYEAVRTGKTGNDFINTIAHAGKFDITNAEGLAAVMNYRLSEANMYLNGGYGYNAPSSMGYSVLDLNGNEVVEASDKLVAYSTASGYSLERLSKTNFMGWYVFDGKDDDKIGGAPITKLNKDTRGDIIVAKFGENNVEVYADYEINTSSLSSRYLFSQTYSQSEYKDNIDEKKKDTLKSNSTFTITKEKMVDGVKWAYGSGKNTSSKKVSGWIYMGEISDAQSSSKTPIATATVTAENLNIREGATVSSKDIGDLKKGVTVNIYEIKVEKTDTGNQSWGKVIIDGLTGWINLAYTDVNETLGDSDSAEGQTGKIVNTDYVNVRKSPEITATNIITELKKGTKVTVLETKMNGSAQWGLVEWEKMQDGYTKGWVYMYYVELDDAPHSNPSGSTNLGDVLYTGVVTSNINLNVREKADIYADKVGSLPTGTKINIYETKTSKNMKWGRIGDDQWVCLTYVKLTEVESGSTGTSTTTDTQATVTSATLDVLKNYNSNAEKVGTLKKGTVVSILEKNTEKTETGSRIWGRISKDGIEGWINLAYVELKTVTSVSGSTGSTGSVSGNANGAAAVISDCISVNVREAAGVSNAQITKLNNGTAIKVYEQVTKDNAPWARITWNNGANEGWVCMNYVTMSGSTGTGTTEGGLVNGTNSNTISATGYVNSNIDLNVRAGAGLGYAKLGSLKKGTKVTIYEQVTADGMIWGRTQYGSGSGWVCMSYITVESASSTGKGVMGTIARCFAAVNVRSAPGTGNAKVGTINVGTRVEVFETKTYSGQLWGRVAQGWICMDYVLLDSELPEGEILDATVPTTEAPDTNEPDETINKDNEVAYTVTGTVLADPLNVRNDASADSDKVGTVKQGQSVKILAVKSNNAELWGRIDQYATAGWINMDYVDYKVEGYINTDDQPVYADPDTGSTVKGKVALNTAVIIKKLTVSGETVYGWYQDTNLAGWVPMGRISDEKVEVIPVYKTNTESVGSADITGRTNAFINAYDVTNGSKVVFKLDSDVTVYIGEIDLEAGTVWGKVKADGVEGWINLNSVTYTFSGTVNTETLNVRKAKNTEDEDNILGTVVLNDGIKLCELSFDANGKLWGKVTGNADAVLNGGYVMMDYVTTAISIQTK